MDTVAVRRGRGPRVPVGLPSGDAYTVLLRMFGDREYRRQRGVQVFQQQSECTRSGDGCEMLSDPLRRPLRLTGDRCCFSALGASGLKRCCRVLLLPFPTANQHGTLHTTDGKAIRHRRIIDEHTKRQTSTWATCSRQSVVRSIVVA